eukprot:Mycagemm_TRINITY_DN9435_c0_g1::TRINITY_DN9435_c0_g1_i1::g.3063::m.3063 type:complete len:218 gc:universal TRINITY_DN9435_c0_g1_i1:131-784(+)
MQCRELGLVTGDVALPDMDALVAHLPNFLRHLIDETKVVAHQHQAALKLVDGLSERVDGLEVEMVSGLVEQEDMGLLEGHPREHHTVLEAVRHDANGHRLHLPGHAKHAEHTAHALLCEGVGVLVEHKLQRGHVELQKLRQVLMVPAPLEMRVALDHAVGGLQLAYHELEQCGLAGTVETHEGNARVKINSKVELAEQNLVGRVTKGDVAELAHGRR